MSVNKKDIQKILNDVKEDWDWQVKDMSDEELAEDRSYWMKYYGRDHDTDEKDMDDYESDVHTLAIEIEQMRRMGEIFYDERLKPMKIRKPIVAENLMNEIDADKVTMAFSLFVLSRTNDNELMQSLREFRDMFHNQLKKVAKNNSIKTNPNDEITQMSKQIEIENDVDMATERSVNDLSGLVRNLQLDKNSWKKYLRLATHFHA